MASPSVPRPELTLRIHVRVLAEPLHYTVAEMADAARRVFATAGVRIEVASEERLEIPELRTIDIGSCVPGELTSDQLRLFSEREGVPAGEVVVYFVRQTFIPVNGCAAHPEGLPGALVTRGASRWTLAHELGHLLGLRHASDTIRLMFGSGTRGLTRFPPLLVPAEISAARRSPLLLTRGE